MSFFHSLATILSYLDKCHSYSMQKLINWKIMQPSSTSRLKLSWKLTEFGIACSTSLHFPFSSRDFRFGVDFYTRLASTAHLKWYCCFRWVVNGLDLCLWFYPLIYVIIFDTWEGLGWMSCKQPLGKVLIVDLD